MSDAPSDENVISVSFDEDDSAYEALSELKRLDSQHQIDLVGAAVVTRGEDGKVTPKDELDDGDWAGTASGGVIGLLIGIIGGPFGVLIGGATGVLIGSLFDLHDADETDSVLSEISSSVRAGHTALLAQVTEQSPEVADTAMARLGGHVMRRPVAAVEAEMAATEKAQREAKREAHKELHKAKHDQHKAEARAKLDELKTKLHHTKPTARTGS